MDPPRHRDVVILLFVSHYSNTIIGGESDKGIDTVDADGVALAAIQGLNALLIEKDARIVALEAEVAAQKQDLAQQKVQVAALSSFAKELADVKTEMAALRRASPSMVTVASKQP